MIDSDRGGGRGGSSLTSLVQSGARRHGRHGIYGNRGNVVSVSYRFYRVLSGSNPTLSAIPTVENNTISESRFLTVPSLSFSPYLSPVETLRTKRILGRQVPIPPTWPPRLCCSPPPRGSSGAIAFQPMGLYSSGYVARPTTGQRSARSKEVQFVTIVSGVCTGGSVPVTRFVKKRCPSSATS